MIYSYKMHIIYTFIKYNESDRANNFSNSIHFILIILTGIHKTIILPFKHSDLTLKSNNNNYLSFWFNIKIVPRLKSEICVYTYFILLIIY